MKFLTIKYNYILIIFVEGGMNGLPFVNKLMNCKEEKT